MEMVKAQAAPPQRHAALLRSMSHRHSWNNLHSSSAAPLQGHRQCGMMSMRHGQLEASCSAGDGSGCAALCLSRPACRLILFLQQSSVEWCSSLWLHVVQAVDPTLPAHRADQLQV